MKFSEPEMIDINELTAHPEANSTPIMTQEQYDQLSEFYRIYSGLGGNGQAKEYYELALELPIKPE